MVALKENRSPTPIFEMDSDRRYLSVILKCNEAFINDISIEKVSKKRLSKEEIKMKVLELLKEEDLSLREIAKKMGYKGISKTLTLVIEELEKDSLIKQEKNGRSSNIKITTFGRKI